MVWLVSLMIFICVGGCFCDFDCYLKESGKCHNDIDPRKFPETSEDLKTYCQGIQAFGNCVADVREDCGEGNTTIVLHLRHNADYLNTVCDEDNPMFKAVSSNLDCIVPIVAKLYDLCPSFVPDRYLETLDEYIFPLIDEGRFDDLDCLQSRLQSSCQGLTLGYHCGDEVRNVVENMYENLKHPYYTCDENFVEELQLIGSLHEKIVLEELAKKNDNSFSEIFQPDENPQDMLVLEELE